MKKQYLWVLVAASVVAFGAGCKKNTNDNTNDNAIINQGIDLNEALDLNVNIDDDENENVNEDVSNTNDREDEDDEEVNTNSASSNTNSAANKNANTNSSSSRPFDVIKISSPTADEELTSPFYVEGTVTRGDTVYVRLMAGGKEIFTEKVSVRNGAFKGKLLFEFSRTKTGTIEIFQKDAGGAEIDLESVDVTFDIDSTTNDNTNTENDNQNTNDDVDEY